MASVDLADTTKAIDQLYLNPPIHIPIKANHRIRNITQQFNRASEALTTGQLVKDESFSLFDSVQALEIMDPKMDTGYLEPGETLEETYDVTTDILPEEVVWVMDELLCYEMAWQQGIPLAQNLLTSVYVYNLLVQERLPNTMPYFRSLDGSPGEPGPLIQNVLRAFCIGIIKTCDVAIEMIQTQNFYEEEDFNTHTFTLDLLTDISDDEYFELHEVAVAWVTEQEEAGSINSAVCEALVTRLTCRVNFLSILVPSANQSEHDVNTEQFLKVTQEIIQQSRDDVKTPLEASFSSKFQRMLSNTVPPRPIVRIPFLEAVQGLGKLHEDIREALCADSFGRGTSFEALMIFAFAFSSREPLPLARAVLQMVLFNEGKVAGLGDNGGMKEMLFGELRNVINNPACLQKRFWTVELPSDPRYQVARAVDFFLEQAPTEYLNVLRSLCQNRCRIRRCLINVVKDVDTLQKDLFRYFGKDPQFDSGSNFASLVKHALIYLVRKLLLQVMENIIFLGFEQSIYQPFEIAYLHHFLADIKLTSVTNLKFLRLQMIKCKGQIKRVTGASEFSWNTSDDPDTGENSDVYNALCQLRVALTRVGAIAQPRTPYCDTSTQVALRMSPFLKLDHGMSVYTQDFGVPEYYHKPLAKLLEDCSEKLATARKRIWTEQRSMQGSSTTSLSQMEIGVTAHVERYILDTHTILFRALVAAVVAVSVLQRELKEVSEGEEERLVGRVRATFKEPVLGDYYAAPYLEIVKAAQGAS